VNLMLDSLAAVGRGVMGAFRVTGSLTLFAAIGLSHLVRPPFYGRLVRCSRSAISAYRSLR
jgi:phospholipid/cholesterol/gamma-HCH transport system permease protein